VSLNRWVLLSTGYCNTWWSNQPVSWSAGVATENIKPQCKKEQQQQQQQQNREFVKQWPVFTYLLIFVISEITWISSDPVNVTQLTKQTLIVQADATVTLWTCIRKVFRSNLGHDTVNSDSSFPWFSSIPPRKFRDSNSSKSSSRLTPYNLATQSVVKQSPDAWHWTTRLLTHPLSDSSSGINRTVLHFAAHRDYTFRRLGEIRAMWTTTSLWTSNYLNYGTLAAFSVGTTPWTLDQPVARPLPTHRTTQTHNKRTDTSTLWVRFEPTIPAFERAKTVHAFRLRGHCGRRSCSLRLIYPDSLAKRRHSFLRIR
jgi:hypothetical protein